MMYESQSYNTYPWHTYITIFIFLIFCSMECVHTKYKYTQNSKICILNIYEYAVHTHDSPTMQYTKEIEELLRLGRKEKKLWVRVKELQKKKRDK